MKILIVDDEKLILDIFEEYLAICGHVSVTAQNGRQALDFYLEDPDGFDMIVTDINMPIIDGIELAYRIRAVRLQTPIIFVSGRLEADMWDDINQLQPCEWLKKPFPLEQLGQLIDSWQARRFEKTARLKTAA
ncbi:MAG: response regulator [Caldilineaceae bacterium]|nr:response regulator [Caldilineaceae bacterium]MCB0143842.1 response regulator [Caldilineaceae bacterium]MCB9156148.1 response regulator [Caldilineaceae bacterium]